MSADTTKPDYDQKLRELCVTGYGMTPVETEIAEVLHAACWCQSTHDAYAEDGGLYEGCGPWTEREVVRGLMTALAPAHYREAAASLRALGHDTAADLLDSTARDLTEGTTNG